MRQGKGKIQIEDTRLKTEDLGLKIAQMRKPLELKDDYIVKGVLTHWQDLQKRISL